MQFATPEAFYLLLVVPLIGALLYWGSARRTKRAAALGDRSLIDRLSMRVSPGRDRVKSLLLIASIVSLVLSLARPQWGQAQEEVVVRGVDVFLVLDTSFSMDAPDVAPSRMERARYIASELIERLRGNRVGLVVFSGSAFVQCPLTVDYGAARVFLDTVTTGIVPEPGTDIAGALERARASFVSEQTRYRVVVLLTDGEELSGSALGAAEKLRDENVVVHAIGVGTPGGQPIPLRDERGEVTDYVRDDSGEPVLSRLDEETLSRLALSTGGKYFRIAEQDREIEAVASAIQAMEGEELQSQLFRRYQERFYWPLGFALAFLLAETLVLREGRG